MTKSARAALFLAQDEAKRLNQDSIETEHLLLGLLGQSEGVAAQVLAALGVGLSAVRSRVQTQSQVRAEPPTEELPLSPQAQGVLGLALRQSWEFGHGPAIHTEDILMAIGRLQNCAAASLLVSLGADYPAVRREVLADLVRPAATDGELG